MNSLLRARTNCMSGSNPRSNDRRSILSSMGAGFPPALYPPSIRRGTWPLLTSDAVKARPLPMALETFVGEGDRLDRIRLGGAATETRSLNVGAALAALEARLPGTRRGNGHGAGQLATVFDEARGAFVGWRPKVRTWACGGADEGERSMGHTLRAF